MRVPNRGETEELLDLLILGFIHMVGVFDALAFLAAKAVRIELSEPQIGWQKRPNLSQLEKKCPPLYALVGPGTAGSRTFGAICAVRNTIHLQMPNPALSTRHNSDPAHDHAVVIFESGAHDKLLEALDAAGWSRFIFDPEKHPESFRDAEHVEMGGVTRVSNMLFMRPETLLLKCLNDGVPLVNALMAATPVETFGTPTPATKRVDTLYPISYPISLQRYAVDRVGLKHLATHLADDGRAVE